jgi:hypothetical protein
MNDTLCPTKTSSSMVTPFANKRMAGNFHTATNFHTTSNFDERTNFALIANLTAIQVHKAIDLYILTQDIHQERYDKILDSLTLHTLLCVAVEQRLLGGFDDLNNAQSFYSICDRRFPREDAFKEMQAFAS